MIKNEPKLYSKTTNFEISRKQLNLKMNQDVIYECYVVYQEIIQCLFLTNQSVLAVKLVEKAHLQTIHGGVTLTMGIVRDLYWIPTLRELVKRRIKRCYGCKRFNISHYPKPLQGLIPTDRTK